MNLMPIASTIEALGWTLLHFLWQGAAVALALGCFLSLARKAAPQVRYAAGCAALLAMLVGVALTLGRQLALAREAPPVATAGALSALPPAGEVTLTPSPRAVRNAVSTHATPMQRGGGGAVEMAPAEMVRRWPVLLESTLTVMESGARPWLSWIVGLWAAGVGLLSARLLACWSAIRGIRVCGRAPEGEHALWLKRFERLRQHLGVSRAVRLVCTAAAGVPMVIGWLKPVVLVPAGLLTGLSVSQLEAILAHELVHIRRHDYLVNLLQNVMETLLFYHPAVWWVSGHVRREREHCCDDAASAVCADAVAYARALAALEEWRGAPAALGVSAGGSTLPGRIRRLVGIREPAPRGAGWPVVASVLAICAAGALLIPTGAGRGEEQEVPGGIRITVLNSTGKNPIRAFRVIAGVRSRATSEEFTKRTGREVVNWQPHTVRIGKDGSYVWPLEQAYDEMALRVEADGYGPQVWTWAKKADGAQHVIFKLVEDAGVRGRVLRPDGGPAEAATVALALPQKNAVIEQGRIHGAGEPLPEKPDQRWRRPTLVKAGPDGRFLLPTEIDPAAAVLVVHESGVREMAYAEFRKAPEITLTRWGRIEGTVLWKDKPGAEQRITLSIWRDDYGYPGMISSSAKTQTDADGRFTFDKVLPGRAQISRPIRPSEDGEGGAGEFIFDGLFVHAQVQPGDPTPVLLGGRGRTLTGRLIGRERWDDVTFHFHPDAPHIGFPGDNDAWKAFGSLRSSAIGPLFFRNKLRPNADGTFEIPDMLPGRYQFFVSAPGVDNYAAYTVIGLDPEKPDEAPEPLDLGDIPVKAAGANRVQDDRLSVGLESGLKQGELPPPFNVTKIAGPDDGVNVGALLDYTDKWDPRPMVLIFSRKPDRQLAALLEPLDDLVRQTARTKFLKCLVVFLVEDSKALNREAFEALKVDVQHFADEIEAEQIPITIAQEQPNGRPAYHVNENAAHTIIMYKNRSSGVQVNRGLRAGELTPGMIETILSDTAKILLDPEDADKSRDRLDLDEDRVAGAHNEADPTPAEIPAETKLTADGGAAAQLDTEVLQDALRKGYESNLAKSGKASLQLGGVEGWVLAYDNQRSLRRYRAARQARLRIMPDGKVLANPQRESLAIAEDRLTPEELNGLLASLADDPQTQEQPLKTPLQEMSVAQQHSALSVAIMSAARPTWEAGGAAVVFRFGDKILQRDLGRPDDPVFQRLHAILARAYAGGRKGIQRYLEFANTELAARHPEAPRFDERDFWGAGFDGDGTGTLAVFFRYEGRTGVAARSSVRHRPGAEVYLYEAVYSGDVEDVWGRKHERRGDAGEPREDEVEETNRQPDGKGVSAPNVDAGGPKTPTSGNEDSSETGAISVTIRGKAIDAETGEPVFPLITQTGKFDPADPAKVTWGYSEGRSSARNGTFSTTVRWAEGWTARVLADGYLPSPVLTKAPPAGQEVVEVLLRLKRGRLVRGRVLDHQGQPVKGAAVFAVGPTGLNLAAGKAWRAFGGEDKTAKPVLTDAAGRFELPAGEAERLAVSSESLDAWPAAIPNEGDVVVKLPAPARIEVVYDIEGAAAKGEVFYQLLSHDMPGFERIECTRELPITGGGTLTLAALPPGKYQICRQVRSRVGQLGLGAMLDRQFLELKAGETRAIRFVREKGARLRGEVIRPEGTKLAGVVVTVKSEKTEKDPFEGHEWQTEFASDTAAEDGTFHTELIPPGRHLLVAEAYTPLTREQRFRTGEIAPAFRAEVTVDVPATGEVVVPAVRLKKVSN